ncbi:hypothetical protein Tco_1453826, partial [Tanacetum coccineum]
AMLLKYVSSLYLAYRGSSSALPSSCIFATTLSVGTRNTIPYQHEIMEEILDRESEELERERKRGGRKLV